MYLSLPSSTVVWLALALICFFQEVAQAAPTKSRGCRVKQRDGRYVVVCSQGVPSEGSERSITRRRGSRGKKGEQGKIGPPGAKGPPGSVGEQGSIGSPGLQGVMGPRGVDGIPGKHGQKGSKGEQGIQGLIGPEGKPGIPGNCLKVSPSIMKNSAVHCLAGPTGPRGPSGKAGTEGTMGPQGTKGQQGEAGQSGPPGSRGMAGLPGLPGTLGQIMCRRRYSKWVTVEIYQSGSYDVGCNVAEFMQSFALETSKSKVRYRFNCCGFT